ncbi:MAG: UDP-N-acetylglucosamine acyltransferase, partial [Candidatus Marinamargulisbacteria bacterium]
SVEDRKKIVGIKNFTINEPFFQGHLPNNPIVPAVLILESMIQTGSALLLKDEEFSGRFAQFDALDKVLFTKSVVPGDQLRLEMEVLKIKENSVIMQGHALVEGRLVCEGKFTFSLKKQPSRPQIHPTASVHSSAILGKDVVIGPNTIVGEHVIVDDRTILEGHILLEKWTRIGADCHIHFGCVIGSAAQDAKYNGEKSWVVIGDRNQFREYVTINRSTGKDTVTKIGNDNTFLTNVHIAHNCEVANNVVIANMTNIAGHTIIEDRAIIGGMTGVHQFVRIGQGSMVGAYTRLPQDVPPFMLCEGNPAYVRGVNMVGLRRSGLPKLAITEIKEIYKIFFRSGLNVAQAMESIVASKFETEASQQLVSFLAIKSHRGITKKKLSEKEEVSVA